MSLLIIAARGSDTTPYQMPTAAPWNAPVPAVVPTYEGSGVAIHPDVVDMRLHTASGTWRGWRYWMAFTPLSSEPAENPSIVVSQDGYTWQVPAGLTNPIDPWPGQATGTDKWYNSDTDLSYDPGTGELLLIWREAREGIDPALEILWLSRSTDGATWTAPVNILQVETAGTTLPNKLISPSLVRLPSGTWRMYMIRNYGGSYLEAPRPEGPWGATTAGSGFTAAHVDVILHAGTFYAVGHTTTGVKVGASTDGLTWATVDDLLLNGSGRWDSRFYRSTMQPHENGTHMRLWYSGNDNGPQGWRIGYTQIPLAAWAAT